MADSQNVLTKSNCPQVEAQAAHDLLRCDGQTQVMSVMNRDMRDGIGKCRLFDSSVVLDVRLRLQCVVIKYFTYPAQQRLLGERLLDEVGLRS